jgi:hypothetical protein
MSKMNVYMDGNGSGKVMIDGKGVYVPESQLVELQQRLDKARKTAEFYRDCSGNKDTFKFGYSRVLEELNHA